jgi:2'-5' RNA ligase
MNAQEELPRRLFVGLRPPEDVLRGVERAVAPHRSSRDGWRWTPRDEWHITVRFLGSSTQARSVAGIVAAVAARTPAFSVQFGGFGAFPAPHRAHTLWLGLEQGEHRVAALERALTPPLDKLGFGPDRRRFSAHLTLCRIRDETDARMALVELGRAPVGVRWLVDELVLFESTSGGGSARYVPLAVARLARPTR